jgi:hypothetical protein
MFLLSASILYAFEKQSHGGGGLMSGTSALGVVAGIIGAAVPHMLRPLLDTGFYFVTFDVAARRRCQNEDGMTWETWHQLAEERRRLNEEERQALARRMEEDRKSGLHMLRTALTTELDEGGWEDKERDDPFSRPTSPAEVSIDVPFSNPMLDLQAMRALTHDADVCIEDAGNEVTAQWEPAAHDAAAELRERHRRLEAKWSTPLSQPWWGPVETHHLLVGAAMVLCLIALISGFQNMIHQFSPSACADRTSPLAVALLISFFFDVFLFEPVHQVLRLLWRYALEHEGNVDYTSTLARRLSKLITLESVPHPYRGAMLLWPESSLAEGTAYAVPLDDDGVSVPSVAFVDMEEVEAEPQENQSTDTREVSSTGIVE